MTTTAAFFNIRTIAIGVALGVASSGAHVLDGRVGLLADPHQEHGFNGGKIPIGFRVIAFGDALSVAATEQVMAHDPTAAFTVGGLSRVTVRVGTSGPGGREPGGIVGILGKSGTPLILGKRGIPCGTQFVNFVEGRGAGGTGAGR